MGGTTSTPWQTSQSYRLLWIDLEGAPHKGVPIWDTAILHDTGSVRYVRWNTAEQRKRLRKSVPAGLVDVITGDKYPQGTTHRIDQDRDLGIVAHAVCDNEYECELAQHLAVADNTNKSTRVVSWSSYDLRALCDAVLKPEDTKAVHDKKIYVNALKRARHYFTVPSFSLAKSGPGSIRKALKAADFAKTPGCGSGPHCALYDALTMREVCQRAVDVLRAETDGNMTIDRFLGIEIQNDNTAAQPAASTKHDLTASVTTPVLTGNGKKPSDVDKVFDIQRQIDGAHVAWVLAHQNEHYWDDSGKLHNGTSREFKTKVRNIMGPVWCQDNGHRLNATRTKEGILRLLAQAARVV